jgi:CRP-like cAMP-binding protein
MLADRAVSRAPRLRLLHESMTVDAHSHPVRQSAELSPLFADMPPSDCAKVVSEAWTIMFIARQTIFLAGDPIKETLLLTEGSVKVTQLGKDGCSVILRLEGPGGMIGSIGPEDRGKHSSTVQALISSEALYWSVPTFAVLSERFPLLGRNMIRIVSQRLEALECRFQEIFSVKAATRLARELVRMLPQIGRKVDGALEIYLSREELAEMTAITTFTVSRLLAMWERRGIVSLRPQSLMVLDLVCLSAMTELAWSPRGFSRRQ